MMRRMLTLLLALGLTWVARADGVEQELKALQGKWGIVSVERDGKVDAKWKDGVRLMEGDKYTLTPKEGAAVTGRYKIDPGKKPKAIDIMPDAGQFKGKTLPGIYVIEGDVLKICFAAEEGKERPTEFVSRPGSGHILAVHKREK
jgi:uncharacterized protein (TIGR03067 family)